MNIRKALASLAVVATLTLSAATAPVWEDVTAPSGPVIQQIEVTDANGDLDVKVIDGYIYLRCEKPTNIKIFSILGQQITSDTLKPGVHRIRMASRGIYILRTGSTTRRVTI